MPETTNSAATIDFESELWRAADALRSNMDAVPEGSVNWDETQHLLTQGPEDLIQCPTSTN